MTTRDKAKWLRFLILILGGGTIYKLANLKDAFYVPMQEFMGLSHAEIGLLLSANAIIATALFVVGGMLADRFEHAQVDSPGAAGHRQPWSLPGHLSSVQQPADRVQPAGGLRRLHLLAIAAQGDPQPWRRQRTGAGYSAFWKAGVA